MCVICAKEKGVNPPTKEELQKMFNKNPDGAGYMYADGKKVHIVKGFMSFNKFYKHLEKFYKTIDAKDAAIVYHFRITTSGGSTPQNCHPFPVSGSLKDLQKTNFSTDLGVAHNGVIDIRPIPETSDTMTFITTELSKLYKSVPNFLRDENLLEMIESRIDSKLCFLEPNGTITTVGDFTRNTDGTLVSNRHYMNNPYLYIYDNVTNYMTVRLAPVCFSDIDSDSLETLSNMGYDFYSESLMVDADNGIYIYSDYYKDAEFTGLINAEPLDIKEEYFEPYNVLC